VEHLFVDAGDLRMQLAQAGQGKPIVMLHGWRSTGTSGVG
jgi:hypothetical protein